MPTGYTACVVDGSATELRDYAFRCARGMMALITMRDDPWDAPIPEKFEPDLRYYDTALAAARDLLALAASMNIKDCAVRAQEDYRRALDERNKRASDRVAETQRYDAMIAKVEAWTTGAEGLRDFMLQQLRQGRAFDCGGDLDLYDPAPEGPLSGEDWKVKTVKAAAKDVGYHEQKIAEEIARTADRNRWLAALHASLPEPERV